MNYGVAKDGVFWTLQGEGHLRGLQMAFVRLAGCSVGCPSCDTHYALARRASAEELADEVVSVVPEGTRDRWAWITGGEPTDHELRPLIRALRSRGFCVALATAGVRRVVPPVDWLSVSPHDPAHWVQLFGDELKVVPALNGFPLEAFVRSDDDFMFRYVQPLGRDGVEDPESLRICMEFLRTHPNWGLSRQDHKHWGVP